MRRNLLYIVIAFFILSPLKAQVHVLTIGDSTMADYDDVKNSEGKEKRGWCQMLPMFFTEDIKVDNAARNGRSSKSFYFEFWENLRENLMQGDYVFIQFGHNDEKNNGADTDESDQRERGTAPWGQYQKYLRKYIIETRERGANPVLITPVVRRMFNSDGKTLSERGKHNLIQYSEIKNDSILNYVMAMKAVANEMRVPLIDMTEMTAKLVENYGPDKSKQIIYCKEDNTHLQAMGGILFSKFFVKKLAEQNIFKEFIKYPSEVVVSPTEHDFGPQLVTTPIIKTVSFSSIDLQGVQNIELSVETPFQLSVYPDREYQQSLLLSGDGDFYKPVFVRFIPDEAISYKQELEVSVNGKKKSILLCGVGIEADKDKIVEVRLTSDNSLKPIVTGKISADLKTEGLIIKNDKKEGMLITTPDSQWSNQEIDMNASRYIELSIKAESYDIYINRISFALQAYNGEKVQFTALGSLNEDFTKTDSFAVMESLSNNRMKSYSYNAMVKIGKGKTYRLRIYPWDRAGGENYIMIDNISVKGLGK